MTGNLRQARNTFLVYLIKPSHYDDDGYVIRWLRSAWEIVYKHACLAALILRYGAFRQWLKQCRSAKDYTDLSLTPVDEDEFDALEMFAVTQSAKAAVEKMRSKGERRARRAAAG